jgi:archaemetzincin
MIVPVGEIPGHILTDVRTVIADTPGATVVVRSGADVPTLAYNTSRRQYHSTRILDRPAAGKPRDCERLIGVADVDLYVPDLNLVFGEADSDRGVAVFSLARLRPRENGRVTGGKSRWRHGRWLL